jgi:hypothetical protein
MYVYRNTEARLCGHCCRAKAVSIAYSECVFLAFRCPTCNAHAPYCHLWPARLYNTFPRYLINGTIPPTAQKTLVNTKYVFRLSLQNLSETFFFLSGIKRDVILNVYVSACKTAIIVVTYQ